MKRKKKVLIYVLSSILLIIVLIVVFLTPILEMLLSKRMSHYKIPGVGITLINENKIKWSKSYGFIKDGSDTPVSTETLFQAASTTKLLVSSIALRLVEQGLLDLDKDINKYLKSWKIPENDFTRKKKVTLRLLLTHQSGLPETNFPHEDGSRPSLIQVLNGELPAQNKPAIVEYIPGSKWQYSNIGYVVIQFLIEDLTGKSLQQIMQQAIFEPLNMDSSTFVYPLNPELKKREAIPHDAKGKARKPSLHPTAVAQGGLITTPSDLAKFTIELMRAYQGKSNQLLSQKMARHMFHREIDLDPNIIGHPCGTGLGVFLLGKEENCYFLSPGENYPGSTCWLIGIPDLGKGAVIMTNGAKGNQLAMEVLIALAIKNGWPNVDE